MDLIERLILLGNRQEEEGWYTNANICWSAADEIKRLMEKVKKLEDKDLTLTKE